MEAVAEELGGWRKEVDELEEMKSQSGELQLGKDFISQLDTFLPVSCSVECGYFSEHFNNRSDFFLCSYFHMYVPSGVFLLSLPHTMVYKLCKILALHLSFFHT